MEKIVVSVQPFEVIDRKEATHSSGEGQLSLGGGLGEVACSSSEICPGAVALVDVFKVKTGFE